MPPSLPSKLGGYLRDLQKLTDDYDYRCVLYGHFGDGCVHNRIDFDLQSAEGIKKFRRFMEEAADLVVSFGGSLSGEHGDGQARAELLPKMFGPELVKRFREFKALWDPEWKMNPGKVVIPTSWTKTFAWALTIVRGSRKRTSNFRTITAASPRRRCAALVWASAAQYEGGMMCPSFRVTREEEHSTRGRAHLLWEMTTGRRHPRRLARRAREVVARSLPVLQRMQERLSGRGGCRDLQGRVSFAPL